MMTNHSPRFKSIKNLSDLNKIVSSSRQKPVLVFKHKPSSKESSDKKDELEKTWNISSDLADLYIVEDSAADVANEVSDLAGIDPDYPQIVLFADGVTMYDESGDMISVKKILLALKIVNRTFKWMETRA